MSAFTKDKFRRLPLAMKYKIVEEFGKYLMFRKHLHYSIELFKLQDFYVEVWRSMATNQVYWVECQSETYINQHYLNEISLQQLMD
jgi:hypothetical protein